MVRLGTLSIRLPQLCSASFNNLLDLRWSKILHSMWPCSSRPIAALKTRWRQEYVSPANSVARNPALDVSKATSGAGL